jgi:hypothetical protein
MTAARLVNKNQILQLLKRAREASIQEQDGYRKIFEMEREEPFEAIKERVRTDGWKAILKIMKDCGFPPVNEDRKKHLGLEWDQTLNRIKLNKIRDKDIRSGTYFLNEFMEHTQRLRSMAIYIQAVGTMYGRWGVVFDYWASRQSLLILKDEALQMGMDEKVNILEQVVNAIDEIADIIFEDVWTDTPRELNQDELLSNLDDHAETPDH